MKCCACNKEIDTGKNNIPPAWFGRYYVAELIEVICAACMAEPEKRKRWALGRYNGD